MLRKYTYFARKSRFYKEKILYEKWPKTALRYLRGRFLILFAREPESEILSIELWGQAIFSQSLTKGVFLSKHILLKHC